jgi:hypothetical protein
MKDFKPIDNAAESVEKRMTFIQEFLQKKYGFGILYFFIIGFGIYAAVKSYNEGVEYGAKSSQQEIKSLKESSVNDNEEINTLKGRVAYYKKQFDSCNNMAVNLNLEDEVRKQLEKSKRLERLLEIKISNTEKQTNEINQIIKK